MKKLIIIVIATLIPSVSIAQPSDIEIITKGRLIASGTGGGHNNIIEMSIFYQGKLYYCQHGKGVLACHYSKSIR